VCIVLERGVPQLSVKHSFVLPACLPVDVLCAQAAGLFGPSLWHTVSAATGRVLPTSLHVFEVDQQTGIVVVSMRAVTATNCAAAGSVCLGLFGIIMQVPSDQGLGCCTRPERCCRKHTQQLEPGAACRLLPAGQLQCVHGLLIVYACIWLAALNLL
jgi:hypothetical protein